MDWRWVGKGRYKTAPLGQVLTGEMAVPLKEGTQKRSRPLGNRDGLIVNLLNMKCLWSSWWRRPFFCYYPQTR